MQDPIRSSTPTMTVGTTEARAMLESPMEKSPEDRGRPEDWLPLYDFFLNRSNREACNKFRTTNPMDLCNN
jgi:hypothetical protein